MTQTQQIALVTGGSRGLGKDMALSLARKGISVILTYNSKKEEALQVVKEIEQTGQKAAALQFNVGNIGSFDAFVTSVSATLKDSFGADKLHSLVNNAGIGVYAPFAETTETQFDELLNIQFKGVFFLTQKLLPLMADGGAIVNVSTGLARFTTPGYSAYAAMKGAIEVLTRYQAQELGARGIRSNVIAPGAIETDFAGGVVRDTKALNDLIASHIALGRVGVPEDIGAVVAFLCSEESRWVNGQRLEASGGMHL
ncbi:SDR family oxidoreductase [Chitinophaga agrisoli]|uniref:SDR family oxidoreductase n=1 Tax=Chitinophaga agrisoli TaxID=2607653 RepID=A0A5B2VRE2_9BACT|nr:SDR family oxidoreductase [Chitinophaga agrisoli]KAA2240747.1 SDR family oxidoreductase [Chitinophaga agrisoli]